MAKVKVKPLNEAKALLMKEIREAVEEMKLIRAGEKSSRCRRFSE